MREQDPRLAGLYVITDPLLGDKLQDGVRAALAGGARLVQYRDKSADTARRLADAQALTRLCGQHDALLIVNDDVELARAVDAHGVHLGRDDADIVIAREALGEHAVIGVSCYNELERARKFAAAGADYLAFGSVYPSPTKPAAVRASLQLFRDAQSFGLPLCAIGGIDVGNIRDVIAAGADMAAVISAVFAAEDIETAARLLSDAWVK